MQNKTYAGRWGSRKDAKTLRKKVSEFQSFIDAKQNGSEAGYLLCHPGLDPGSRDSEYATLLDPRVREDDIETPISSIKSNGYLLD